MIRSFLALPLPENLQLYLSRLSIPFMDTRDKINWVPPGNIHITLAFLGDTDEASMETLAQELKVVVSKVPPLELHLDDTGVFPHANDPKILYAGAFPFTPDLSNLRTNVNKILLQHGYRVDNRKFQPHITLGRVKSISRKSSYIHDFLITDVRAMQFTIDSVNWLKSTLTPMGAQYEVLKTFKFKQGE